MLLPYAAMQRPGAHSFDLTFYMYRLLEMSDKYRVRLRLVEVPQDADFGARCVTSLISSHGLPLSVHFSGQWPQIQPDAMAHCFCPLAYRVLD